MTYQFRREDNGEVVEVDFAYMIEHQDAAGFITLPDGTPARRVNRPAGKPQPKAESVEKKVVSDALGFFEYQLDDFEAARKMYGFRDIEFRRDPTFPQFFQVVGSRKAMDEYAKHRGLEQDRNPTRAAALSPQMLERARERVVVEYGSAT